MNPKQAVVHDNHVMNAQQFVTSASNGEETSSSLSFSDEINVSVSSKDSCTFVSGGCVPVNRSHENIVVNGDPYFSLAVGNKTHTHTHTHIPNLSNYPCKW